jgi:hypothetical protein
MVLAASKVLVNWMRLIKLGQITMGWPHSQRQRAVTNCPRLTHIEPFEHIQFPKIYKLLRTSINPKVMSDPLVQYA